MADSKQAFKQITILLLIVATFNHQPGHSVIMPPPRLLSIDSSSLDLLSSIRSEPVNDDDDVVPYLLSINEGDSLDINTRSQSLITVNLNRAASEDVQVIVKIYSGPGLIEFGKNPVLSNSTIIHPTNISFVFRANDFGDKQVQFYSKDDAGHAEIVCQVTKQPNDIKIDDSSAYISINIGKSSTLAVIINVVGWMYFAAWSLSFYFQVILNYRRKSVVGLNFDFLALNLLGFTCYTIYNATLLFSRDVQKDYYERNTYGRIPVEYNDLFFALHAFVLTLVTVIQCFIYEREGQKVSIPAGSFIGITIITGIGLYMTSLFQKVAILDVVLYLSYVKLAVTLIKYTPQAYMNYQRKATTGWSIHNILLDFTGGILSLTQMFLLSYNYDDWISIFGNFTKFGLGAISIAFDILFVLQHYVLYKELSGVSVEEGAVPSPVISQSVISASRLDQDGVAQTNNSEPLDNLKDNSGEPQV